MIFRTLVAYITIFILFTIVYIFSFHSPLINSQHVLFYRGISLLLFTALLITIISVLLKKQLSISWETVIAANIISALIHLSLFVTFPVTYDRAISIYLLNRLNNYPINAECKGYSKPTLEKLFIREYVEKQQAINRRLNEQSIIKFITQDNQCIALTDKAKKFLQFSDIVKKIYGVK